MTMDRPVATLAVSQTLIWAALFYVFPATLLRWEADLGWSKAELALAITLAILASAIGAPVAGKIVDRGHGPALMGAASALGGVGLLALAQVNSLPVFYAIWIAMGFAMAGSLYDACFALITCTRGAAARGAIVWVTLVAGFAGTVSFPTVHVLSDWMGWRAAFTIMGVVVICGVAPLQWLGARGLGPADPGTGEATAPDRPIRSNPVFWLLGLALASLALVHGATLHHLLPMLDERAVPLGFAVFIASLIGPMQVAGRLVMVALGRFASPSTFLLVAFASIGLSLMLLRVAGDSAAVLLGFVTLFGSAWGMVSILRPVIARDLLGQRNFGAKSGYLTLLFLTAAAGSALFGALIWSWGGYDTLLIVQIALACAGAALYLRAARHV